LKARDARFDGRLFVAVTTTGIYCRPVCPANPAKPEHCRFYPSAAAAQAAGFRPCLRCRPETAPAHGSWNGSSNTVTRGLALIAEGTLDGEDASVERLAERLGVGERQLRRLFQQHLGASPIAVAQTRRVLFAKQLIHETRLPMTEVALAAGFGSVRRFNEAFQRLYARPPSALRRTKGAVSAGADGGVSVRLRYRSPYDFSAMLAFLGARAIDGVERVEGQRYFRTLRHDDTLGSVEVAQLARAESLVATLRFPNVKVLPGVIARIRRAFDVDVDVAAVEAHLGRDPWLAPLVAARPGLRAAGAWDGFELGVRAVLGQQVSLAAARTLCGKLVRLCGTPLPASGGSSPPLAFAFPTPAEVHAAKLEALGMPQARRRALTALATAALDDPELFRPLGSVEETVARLRAVPGLGAWSAHYIALRAAREPDAFPASDLGLLRGATRGGARRVTAKELERRSERWRPFRAYAAEQLWAADAARRNSPGDAA
jgi:AraC family transcriptional regulator of adaptative response / DNA-3-methyladenine glycosylase II